MNRMFQRKFPQLRRCVLFITLLVPVSYCVDPVSPEFEFRSGFVYIDALVSTAPGTSYAIISRSVYEFGVNKNTFIRGAAVSFINSRTGASVHLTEDKEIYIPPADFMAEEEETWELNVVLGDGTQYHSAPEKINAAVSISDLDVHYDQELEFNEDERYLPGHRIEVSFDDPKGADNHYLWRYRTFERLEICHICYETIFRDGECFVLPQGQLPPAIEPYYTYACDRRCWRIRYSDKINIFSDEFTDGTMVRKLPVADILLYTTRNILVELQQFSLTPDAFRYYKTLKDLIDNNSGFNAPLPAALVGNLYNPEDPDEFVLGRFMAAPTTVRPVFIERNSIKDNPLEAVIVSRAEGMEVPFPPLVYSAPCQESRYQTSKQPEAWVE